MNNKIYSLIALGTILFAAACSDNVSPISGSTSVPNMDNNLNIPQSPVLCSVIGVTDSLEAREKGCIWSPEMWGPTSGYRVRTGYDNGSNTSGIWIVSTYPENAYVDMIWPGNATAEYDSLALADVIDKCGGSLCGKALLKGGNSIPEYNHEYYQKIGGYVYFDFYLAGKNASGEFESVDVRNMEGVCVSYWGSFFELQLITDDSVAAQLGSAKFAISLFGTYSDVRNVCYSWNDFGFISRESGKIGMLPKEDVLSHVKGIRFVLSAAYEKQEEFKIAGISRYNASRISTNNLHPVITDCEPVFVEKSFCECEYSDDRIHIYTEDSVAIGYQFSLRFMDALVSSDSAANDCLNRTFDNLMPYIVKPGSREKPCDNPLPVFIRCSDGTVSESVEFKEVSTGYYSKIDSLTQDAAPIADSLIAHCLSL